MHCQLTQRFELKQEEGTWFIRATQGHSISHVKPESLLNPILDASEVPVCVHGTFLEVFWIVSVYPFDCLHRHGSPSK